MDVTILAGTKLHKSYGTHKAVDGVSLGLQPGQIFGLLGPNGAGKSTLISMLSLQLQPDSGSVQIEGRDALRNPAFAKCLMGIVPQDIVLYGELSARDNLLFFGRMYRIGGAVLSERVDELLNAVGLTDRQHDLVITLSGGMKRRLNIAAALVHRPRIVFMDEPTVGVDPHSRTHIFDLVRSLAASGTAILYTTHYMEEAQALCDQVAIIDRGQIIAEGTTRQLIEQYGDGDLIEIEVAEEEQQAAAAAVEGLGDLNLVRSDATTIQAVTRSSAAVITSLIPALQDRKCTPRSIRILQPNLEAVFLRLTGRKLRD